MYIDYCRASGVFRKSPVAVPARAQALEDAAKLVQSSEWQAIQSSDPEEKPTRSFILRQAQAMH